MAKKNSNGITAEMMINAIEESQGYVSKAAEILSISRNTFYVYLKKFATVQQSLDEIREKRHDFVELQMMKLIKAQNPTMIIFYLKTQCKSRGYVERQEVSGVDGNLLKVIVEYENSDRNNSEAA